jgi:presequence protease
VLPSQTNYATETVFVPPYNHPDNPVFSILSELLSRGELHKLIREKGGAYGSGVKFNSLAGSFSFFSYRDPQNLATLENFLAATRYIADGHFT